MKILLIFLLAIPSTANAQSVKYELRMSDHELKTYEVPNGPDQSVKLGDTVWKCVARNRDAGAAIICSYKNQPVGASTVIGCGVQQNHSILFLKDNEKTFDFTLYCNP